MFYKMVLYLRDRVFASHTQGLQVHSQHQEKTKKQTLFFSEKETKPENTKVNGTLKKKR